jgi:hypothetical protein
LDRYYARLGRSMHEKPWRSLIRKWEDLKRKPEHRKHIWLDAKQKKRDRRVSRG